MTIPVLIIWLFEDREKARARAWEDTILFGHLLMTRKGASQRELNPSYWHTKTNPGILYYQTTQELRNPGKRDPQSSKSDTHSTFVLKTYAESQHTGNPKAQRG